MKVTILDLINLNKLDGMKLIAGKKGLNRLVTGCGILDYELCDYLKDKYMYSNFYEGQFVLSTFLYAKDDEHLISNAVKYLSDKNCSGLAIKNIFRLPIHDYVLRYADSKNFPIFIIEPSIYFEDIIISIDSCLKYLNRIDYGQKDIDSILHKPLNELEIKKHALKLNSSFYNHFIAIYFYLKSKLTIDIYYKFISRFKHSRFHVPSNSLYRYRNGLMFIYSCESALDAIEQDKIVTDIIDEISNIDVDMSIGISEMHHKLEEIKQALNECIYAALLNQNENSLKTYYRQIGTYKIIFPYALDKQMKYFCKRIIEPIWNYDAVNNSNLLETLISFIKCEGDINLLSKKLELHENTLRYRLMKIKDLTSLHFREPEHYNQLSTAVKIYICNKLKESFE